MELCGHLLIEALPILWSKSHTYLSSLQYHLIRDPYELTLLRFGVIRVVKKVVYKIGFSHSPLPRLPSFQALTAKPIFLFSGDRAGYGGGDRGYGGGERGGYRLAKLVIDRFLHMARFVESCLISDLGKIGR